MTHPAEAHARLSLLDRLIRIQTLSGAVTEAQVGEVLAFWRELGIAFERLIPENPGGTPALFAEIDSGKPGPTILLYGHYDVQPPGDLDRWRWGGIPCDPWMPRYFRGETEVQPNALTETELNGVLLVGRGGADNKGQHLANILGVLDARDAGTLRGTVKIILDGEEERGSPNLAAIVDQHRDLLAADVLIGSDGPKPAGEPTIVLGVRGLLGVEIIVDNGRGESVHSGNYSNVVHSPVLPLVRLLAGLPDRVNAVAQRHGDFRESVLATFGEAPNRAAWEGFLVPNTNVNGLITEGMVLGKNRTIIPGWALAKIDVRLTPDTPPDEVYAAIEDAKIDETARSRGVTISLRQTSVAPASYTAPDSAAFRRIVAASVDYWDREPQVVPLLGGTLPAFAFTDILGIPAYWLPGAQPNNRQHDVNEHLLLEHFFRQSGWYRAVLEAVAERAP
ncbi:MAG: M20 family metallopeptidase [Dehalococcoidia bacterium]